MPSSLRKRKQEANDALDGGGGEEGGGVTLRGGGGRGGMEDNTSPRKRAMFASGKVAVGASEGAGTLIAP
jgi:hypothetical protein